MDAHVGDYFRYTIFHAILKPMIQQNYKLRRQGKLPDEWYWADRLDVNWGYYV